MARRIARPGTYSIVAHDSARREWGIAVQSKFLSVGAVVPWAQANVGAIAAQANANVAAGPTALKLLTEGLSASEVLQRIVRNDEGREERQFGIVDSRGHAAAFTGSKCLPWAGHIVGNGFCCQGNTLFGEAVVPAMARAFEMTPGDLPERLLAALSAAQREGGDRRGMQSAALLIVRPDGGYQRGNDRWVDLRVDDHPSPIEELKRIFKLYDLTFLDREDPATLVPLTGEVARVVQHHLTVLGYYNGRLTANWDAATAAAFERFVNEHNFENKARTDGTTWPSVLDYLEERAKAEIDRRTRTAPIRPGALSAGPGASPGGGPSTPPKE